MKTLCNTKNRIVVTTGDSKNKAVHEFFLNPRTPMRLFDPTSIVLDQQAAK
jgi:6-phosphogluconolactonase/glucosamine-6-phosphate isomerase/deaminase